MTTDQPPKTAQEYQDAWEQAPTEEAGWNVVSDLIDDYAKLRARVAELEQRQAWIDTVSRPDHPDDERPFALSFIDERRAREKAEQRIAELEARIRLLEPCVGPADLYMIDQGIDPNAYEPPNDH